jgi:hypothetical protein
MEKNFAKAALSAPIENDITLNGFLVLLRATNREVLLEGIKTNLFLMPYLMLEPREAFRDLRLLLNTALTHAIHERPELATPEILEELVAFKNRSDVTPELWVITLSGPIAMIAKKRPELFTESVLEELAKEIKTIDTYSKLSL